MGVKEKEKEGDKEEDREESVWECPTCLIHEVYLLMTKVGKYNIWTNLLSHSSKDFQ